MELTQGQHQGISRDTGRSHRLTINNLPDELLVETFDFYRLVNEDSYYSWSIKLNWFTLIHVCRRWRTVVLESSSRLDLCFVLIPKVRSAIGNMRTIMSRHFPPFPIEIDYSDQYGSAKSRDISRMLAALKRPDRIRGIALTTEYTTYFDKLFNATGCPLPALERFALRHRSLELKIPETFFEGSNLRLRSLSLHPIFLPSISRLLSSAPVLTDLSLGINTKFDQTPITSLLSDLQGMPCLRHLNLEIGIGFIDDLAQPAQPTEPKEVFSLSKLTSFHYRGYDAFLDNLLAMFSAPSLQDVDIILSGTTLRSIPHLAQLIDDMRGDYHAAQLVLEKKCFHFSLLAQEEYVDPRRVRSCLDRSFASRQNWITQTSTAFSGKLATIEELSVVTLYEVQRLDERISWKEFLSKFPSIKVLRIQNVNYFRVTNALSQLEDHGGPSNHPFLGALEKIELCKSTFHTSEAQLASQLASFQPLVSARQRAGHPINVSIGPPVYDGDGFIGIL